MCNIKHVQSKPPLYLSVNLLAGVFPPRRHRRRAYAVSTKTLDNVDTQLRNITAILRKRCDGNDTNVYQVFRFRCPHYFDGKSYHPG